MANPWDDAPIVKAAAPGGNPWDSAPIVQAAPADESHWYDSLKRAAGLTIRAGGPYAAGAAVGAAAGAPLAGVGAIPGAIAGAGAVGLADLGSAIYNPIAQATGLPKMMGPTEAADIIMDKFGVPRAASTGERLSESAMRGMAGAGSMATMAGQMAKSSSTPLAKAALTSMGEAKGMQVASGGFGGAAGQGAAELGLPEPLQFAASLIGGFTPLAVQKGLKSPYRATRTAAKLIQDSMKGKSPQEWADAQRLIEQGQQKGVPLMGPEGFKGGSQIQEVASAVAASPAAGQKMRSFTENRPAQVAQAVNANMADIGANVGGQAAANQAEEAATKVITGAESARSKAVKPYYEAAATDQIPEQAATDIVGKIDKAMAADKTGILSPKLDEMRRTLTEQKATPEKRVATVKDANGNTVDMEIPPAPKAPPIRNFMDELKKAGGVSQEVLPELGLSPKEVSNSAPGLFRKTGGLKNDALVEWAEQNRWITEKQVADAEKLATGGSRQLLHDMVAGGLDKDTILHPADADAYFSAQQAGQEWRRSYGRYMQDSRVIPGKPEKLVTDIKNLDLVRKYFRDKIELPAMSADAMPKEVAGVMNPILADLRQAMVDSSEKFSRGKELYQQISNDRIAPLLKGVIGKVADKGADATKAANYDRVMGVLSDNKPGSHIRIRVLADELKAVDKTAFPNIVRAHLEEAFNRASSKLQGRENSNIGSKLVKILEGTPQDKLNTKMMISKVANTQGQNPTKVYQGFRNLLDVLDATGRVPGMGSQTQTRQEMAKLAHESLAADALEAASFHPLHSAANRLRDIYYRGAYNKLADVFTSPNSIKEMRKLAELKPQSIEAQRMVAGMLENAAQDKKDTEE